MTMITVRQALQHVHDYPGSREITVESPVSDVISRILFEIAMTPDPKVKVSMARAVRAQKMISERLVGRRRAGTHPAQARSTTVEFVDLTAQKGVTNGSHAD